ncbi:MAG: stage 0 sporulation family protein [Nitrospirota bacterium]
MPEVKGAEGKKGGTFNVVGVRYREGCKVYNFDAGGLSLSVGDTVIVDSEQGLGVATVVGEVRPEERGPADKPLKRVVRKASDDDKRRIERNRELEDEAFKVCQQRVFEREMVMKLVRVEWSFDNSKATFYFTADGRVDFRDLVKDLAHRFRIRIEMRQIGVRDEAKMLGGFGPCGRSLCCSTFLRDFEPVSIRMAKKQDLVLNPAKISGICGRLMCCLGYEYSLYDDAKKTERKRCCQDRPCGKNEAGVEEVKVPAVRAASQPKPRENSGGVRPGTAQTGQEAQGGQEGQPQDKKKKRNAWRKRRKKKPGEGGGGASA